MAKRRFRSRGKFRRTRRVRTKRLRRFIKKTIRRMCEIKYVTIPQNALGAFDAQTGTVIPLTPTFTQGSDKDDRIANSIKYKYLQFRGRLHASVAQGGSSLITVRLMIVQMRIMPVAGIAAGAIQNPVPNEIFNDATNNVESTFSSINNNAVRVLMDKTYAMGVLPNAAQSQLPALIKWKKKVRINNNVNFRAGANLRPLDPKDNYFFVVTSDISAANLVNLNTIIHTRISFIDI